MAFCSNCGNSVEDGVRVCPSCGVRVAGPPLAAASSVMAFDWGQFLSDLALKPAEAFKLLRQANLWWLPLAVLFTVGLFWGISILIDTPGLAGGFKARLFFSRLLIPFLYVLFEVAALKLVSGWFKGSGSDFRSLANNVAVSWAAFLPYAILGLIPSRVTDLIFLILSLLLHLWLLTGLLKEEEGLKMAPALLVGAIPFIFLIILFVLQTGLFGVFI
ncbi:MAG: zinc ribbon domain-containing protein [bacterium]